MYKFGIILLIFFSFQTLRAQKKSVDNFDQKFLNWYNLDLVKDNILGASTEKTYEELLKAKTARKTVIVAVIDGGVDIDHDDLKGKIWVNEDEIPDNKIDDDHNGYVDDVHGWNFLGNALGENILYENLETTRIYKSGGSGPLFESAKVMYEAELTKRTTEKQNLQKFEVVYRKTKAIIKNKTGVTVNTESDLDSIITDDEQVLKAINFLRPRYQQGLSDEELLRLKNNNDNFLTKHLNVDFNPRSIIGDKVDDINDNQYGNPDVKGPAPDHGTSVAGVIAAIRDNHLGTNGIATDVKIMVLRTTPRGDERDKDVALAIRYAVENGADIINMSFGKDLSPQKQFVDDAVRLAEKKNILMVHGAGNKGQNIDSEPVFPSDRYLDGSEPKNWLNVGSTAMKLDEGTASPFSNYGQNHVDLFAPGEDILLLDSGNTYTRQDGTSLSGPVVAGVAALVLSYYPELSGTDLAAILMESSYKIERPKVRQPGLAKKDRPTVKFKSLSKSGGVVNAFEAMRMAGEYVKK